MQHMNVGKYYVEDWSKHINYQGRSIYNKKDYCGCLCIRQPFYSDDHSVQIIFSRHFFEKEYVSMFGEQFEFPNLLTAKKRIDIFLRKLSKLRAFV